MGLVVFSLGLISDVGEKPSMGLQIITCLYAKVTTSLQV